MTKLDSNGNAVWVGPVIGPTVTSIAATADGGVVAAGFELAVGAFVTRFTAGGDSVWSLDFGGEQTLGLSVRSAGSPVPRWIDPRSTSSFVVKVQMSGRELWARPLNGVALTALAATTDGGVLAAGTGAPSLVARLTGGGDAVWTTTVGGAGTDALSLAAAGDRFVVAGHSSGSNDFDPSNGVEEIDGSLSFVSLFTDAMLRP